MTSLNPEPSTRFDWCPPASRDEADELILSLSNDIGLILAQLAEDQADWCRRTGRSVADHSAWRRRALFAKAHKESQLRECKRIRMLFTSRGDRDERHSDVRLAGVVAACSHAVALWLEGGGRTGMPSLDTAMAVLATLLDAPDGDSDVDLRGVAALHAVPGTADADTR